MHRNEMNETFKGHQIPTALIKYIKLLCIIMMMQELMDSKISFCQCILIYIIIMLEECFPSKHKF